MVVMDPTRDELLKAFDEFRRAYAKEVNAGLVFICVGYEQSLTDPLMGGAGYIVPIDPPLPQWYAR